MSAGSHIAFSDSRPKRPQVRCPACGTLVCLPALSCPVCQADMKTGFRPEKRFLDNDPEIIKATLKAYLKKWGKYGLALLAPVLAGIYFGLDLQWFAEKRSLFDRLVEAYPGVARPYVATQKAQRSGPPDSPAYHKRLMTEINRTGPPLAADEHLVSQYARLKPGQQIKVAMKVFIAVAAERYLSPKFDRRTGANWAPLIIPVYGPNQGRPGYRVYMHLLANDPRARLGYSFFLPLN